MGDGFFPKSKELPDVDRITASPSSRNKPTLVKCMFFGFLLVCITLRVHKYLHQHLLPLTRRTVFLSFSSSKCFLCCRMGLFFLYVL